jgi:hypothetical protein
LHLFIAGHDELLLLIYLIAGGEKGQELAPKGLVIASFHHAVNRHLMLHLAHLTANSQNHAVIAVGRVVYPVLITEQGLSPPAHVDQMVPVRAIARQA